MKKIKINNENYDIKYTIKALFLFEQITKKPFEVVTLTDNYLLFYCMLLANNPESAPTFEEFIDAVDDNPNLFVEFSNLISANDEIDRLTADEADDEADEKKS